MDAGTAAKLTGLVTGSVDKAAFADADFVIEAVFEDLASRSRSGPRWRRSSRRRRSSPPTPPRCRSPRWPPTWSTPSGWSASTSSTRSRCCRCWRSSAASRPTTPTLATAFAVGKQLKKSCVLVKDAPAFVVNRLLTRFLGEIFAAVDAGTPLDVADSALDPLGLPMRPLALLQLVGPAVAYHVGGTLHARVPGPVRGQREPQAGSSTRASRTPRRRRRGQPGGGRAARGRRRSR